MLNQINLTVTNTAASPAGLPAMCNYLKIHNPNSSSSVAYSFNGDPVVNGVGVTLAPLGTETFDNSVACQINAAGLKLISSSASQAVTIIWGTA